MAITRDMVKNFEEFWNLSWYEWGLLVQRQQYREEQKHKDLELTVYNPLRILWAAIVNGYVKRAKKPTDLLKLSFDTAEAVPEKKAPKIKDVIRVMGKTFKNG
jgi:hypothetical protein